MGVALNWMNPAWGAELMLQGSSFRIGAIMAVVWLAYEDLTRLPKQWVVGTILALVIVAIRPKILWGLLPITVVVLIINFILRKLGSPKK